MALHVGFLNRSFEADCGGLNLLNQQRSSIIIQPCAVVRNGKSRYRDQNYCLYQAVSMFISAVNLDILLWGSMRIDSFLEPASSGHLRNSNF